MASKGYRHAGDIDIKIINLISSSGQLIDISELVVQMDMFQALDEPFMQLEMVLSDSIALLNTLGGGFTGGEIVAISYKSNDDSLELKNHAFVLYQVSSRQKMNDNSEVYMLNGSSLEMYQDMGFKVSRSYGSGSGQLISNMVENLTEEFLYNSAVKKIYSETVSQAGVDVEKTIECDPTSGNQKFIVPMLSPSESIIMLADEADNATGIPYFVFYEDSQGFKFKDLNELINQEPIGQYVYQPKNFDDDSDFYKINSYSVERQNSFFENARSGMLKNTNVSLDIMRRSWNVDVIEYENVHGAFNKLQDVAAPGIVGFDSNPAMFVSTSRRGHDLDVRFSEEGILPSRKSTFKGVRTSFINNLTNIELTVEIPGDSEIDVGKTIILRIPSSSSTDDQNGADDATLSGNYLITRVRHKSDGKTGGDYRTIVSCVKESGVPSDNYVEAQGDGLGGGLSVPDASIGSILPSVDNIAGNITSKFNNISLPTSIGSGSINNIASKALGEIDKFSFSQAIGDGGLDSIFKGSLGIKDKLLSGLPDVNSLADQFSSLGGGIEIGDVPNPGDLKSVLDLGTGEFKGSDFALSDGSEFEVVDVPEIKAKALKPKPPSATTKSFVAFAAYDASTFGNLPEFDLSQTQSEMNAGKYAPGSRFIVKTVSYETGPDNIYQEWVVVENTKYDSDKLRLIDLKDEASVARYAKLGYTV